MKKIIITFYSVHLLFIIAGIILGDNLNWFQKFYDSRAAIVIFITIITIIASIILSINVLWYLWCTNSGIFKKKNP